MYIRHKRRTKQLGIRWTPEEIEIVKAAAKRDKISVTALVVEAAVSRAKGEDALARKMLADVINEVLG